MTFYAYPLRSLDSTVTNLSTALFTVPTGQLLEEMQQLIQRCHRVPANDPSHLMRAIYEAEVTRRQSSGAR